MGQGVGKSETAAAIKHFNRRAVIESFSSTFKELVQDVFYLQNDTVWGASANRNALNKWTRDEWEKYRARFEIRALGFCSAVFGSSLREKIDVQYRALRDWFLSLEAESYKIDYAGTSCRHILQTLGTEWGRSQDEDIWVNCTLRRAQNLLRAPEIDIVIVEDVRLLNESKKLHELYHEIWRIDSRERLGEPTIEHTSEADIWKPEMTPFVDVELNNSGTIVQLYANVERELRRLSYEKWTPAEVQIAKGWTED